MGPWLWRVQTGRPGCGENHEAIRWRTLPGVSSHMPWRRQGVDVGGTGGLGDTKEEEKIVKDTKPVEMGWRGSGAVTERY